MNISFDLLGFDFYPRDSIYGFWFFGVKDYEDMHRNLFCLHYDDGEFRIEFLWFRII